MGVKSLTYTLLFFNLSFVLHCCQAQDVIYECVDNLDEYQRSRWYGAPVSPKYAMSSENLPEVLRGNLKAEGMFYFEGGVAGAQNQSFWKKPEDFEDIQPIYVYLRYYAHVQSSRPKMYIMPVQSPQGPIKYLDTTSDYEWKEELVEINGNLVPWISISIHADMFEKSDYFLLDQVIIVQGATIDGIAAIKEYCIEQQPPTTPLPVTTQEPTGETEVTNSTTTTTTEKPPPSYVCEDAGYFPDPEDCQKFWVCQYNAVGDLWETPFDCPLGFPDLVWCQDILKCEYPEVCPCSL